MELDRKAAEIAVRNGLPVRACWMIDETPLEFDFAGAECGLQSLPDEAIEAGGDEAADLLVFGKQTFARGGGASPWLCVRKRDGAVFGFDMELEVPAFVLNTSMGQFIATFQTLNEHLGRGTRLPSDCESRLRSIDPDAYPRSDWQRLVACLRTS